MADNWFYKFLMGQRYSHETATMWAWILSYLLIIAILVLATLVLRQIVLRLTLAWLEKREFQIKQPLLRNRVVEKISWFIPILLLHLSIDTLLPVDSSAYVILKRMMMAFFVILAVLSINGFLSAGVDWFRTLKKQRADVLQGFVDAGKIITWIFGGIFLVSIFSGMSPWGIISVLGGMTAVTMLVFKDTIVGFVASIQLTTTDMVRVGDWVEMPSYGADGDVISMSIHTIRVQNWDKTITTIPTYALVSNSFKNWRGMAECGGRRIKRSILIDISTIRFCDDQMLARFGRIRLLQDYLAGKEAEIQQYNEAHDYAQDDLLINGRRQTNIGIFRAYAIAYLKSNPNIHQDMTFMVRQLAPTETGLPLEIYVFSKDQRWVYYEDIQSDIFDHLLAALPLFDLRAFQAESDRIPHSRDVISG